MTPPIGYVTVFLILIVLIVLSLSTFSNHVRLTEVERRHMEPGLIRPLPTRGMPPPGMMNGPPPPGMERPPSNGPPPHPPHYRSVPLFALIPFVAQMRNYEMNWFCT